jgi:hypothetical protein
MFFISYCEFHLSFTCTHIWNWMQCDASLLSREPSRIASLLNFIEVLIMVVQSWWLQKQFYHHF